MVSTPTQASGEKKKSEDEKKMSEKKVVVESRSLHIGISY